MCRMASAVWSMPYGQCRMTNAVWPVSYDQQCCGYINIYCSCDCAKNKSIKNKCIVDAN